MLNIWSPQSKSGWVVWEKNIEIMPGNYTFDIAIMADVPSYLTRIYMAHNTIKFWSRNCEKVCMKSSWQWEDAKKGGSSLNTNKNFTTNWFVVCKLGYSRKKDGGWGDTFLEKPLEFPLCYFTFRNSGQNKALSLKILQNCMIPLGNKTKLFATFPWLSLKILAFSNLIPGNSTCYFFNIPEKSKSWKSQFTWLHLSKQTINHKILRRITLRVSFLE